MSLPSRDMQNRRRRDVLRMKSCPRCRGDLILEAGGRDAYWSCLQCGHVLYPRLAAFQPRPLAATALRPEALRGSEGVEALVMGEDGGFCQGLAAHLRTLGVEATAAPSWEAAWQMLAANRPPLVFIDAQEGYISALASAKRIKRLQPGSRVAIVVDWDSDDEDLLLKTADWVIHKPVDGAELRSALESAVRPMQRLPVSAA